MRYVLLGIFFVFFSCSSSQVYAKKEKIKTKFSCDTNSQLIKRYDARNFLLKTKEKSISKARRNVKIDAMCHALTKGNYSILDSEQKRREFLKYENKIYGNIDVYASIKEREKSRNEEDEEYIFEYLIEINEKNLRSDLVDMGVIESVRKLSKPLKNQSFIVIYDKKNDFVVTTIDKYLNDRQFNLLNYKKADKKALNTTLSILNDIYSEEGFINKKYTNSLNPDSDMFIKTKTTIFDDKLLVIATKQVTVNTKRYESPINIIIASKPAHSLQRITTNTNELIEKARNDATNRETKRVKEKWENYLEYGKPIRVLMVNVDTENFSAVGRSFYDALKVFSEDVQLLHRGVSSNDYLVKVKNIKKTRDLFEKIDGIYEGDEKLFMGIAINNFLIIKIGSSNFTIEALN